MPTLEELLGTWTAFMGISLLCMVSNIVVFCFIVMTQLKFIGEDGCTMNVHLLCHLLKCVLDWGPLWCYSCFPFESVNGRLKTHYHGTRCMNRQLGFSYIMLQLLPKRVEQEAKRYACYSYSHAWTTNNISGCVLFIIFLCG